MRCSRGLLASLLTLAVGSLLAAESAVFGTLLSANRSRVGGSYVTAGATLFVGDRLQTDKTGSLQLRAGAARMLLSGDSTVILGAPPPNRPEITLTRGTAVFSSVSSQSIILRVGELTIRPAADSLTIAQVTIVDSRKLIIDSKRGSLAMAVDDDDREIAEGRAYQVVLHPTDAELAAAEASAQRDRGSRGIDDCLPTRVPKPAGRSRLVCFLVLVPAAVTAIALWESLESPDRPNH